MAPTNEDRLDVVDLNLGPKDIGLIASLQQLEAVEEELSKLLTSCSPEAFRRAPDAGGWSPAEVVEHLVQTTEAYLPKLDKAIDKGRRKGLLGRSGHHGALEKWFLDALEPPPRRRFKAPRVFRPAERLLTTDPAASLVRFRASQAKLAERIDAADGLAVSDIKLASPASPLLRFRIAAAFAVLAAHQRRHLWQLRRVLALGETMI